MAEASVADVGRTDKTKPILAVREERPGTSRGVPTNPPAKKPDTDSVHARRTDKTKPILAVGETGRVVGAK